jgi:hypothetical protein
MGTFIEANSLLRINRCDLYVNVFAVVACVLQERTNGGVVTACDIVTLLYHTVH